MYNSNITYDFIFRYCQFVSYGLPNPDECIQYLPGNYAVNSSGIHELLDMRKGLGTPRDIQEGRGYLGDGTANITITGLLTTDTITTLSYLDNPTCTVNGRLDIANGDIVAFI